MPRVTPLPRAASQLTPPIGVHPFAKARISKTTIKDVSVAVLPLVIPYLIMIFLPDLNDGPAR